MVEYINNKMAPFFSSLKEYMCFQVKDAHTKNDSGSNLFIGLC